MVAVFNKVTLEKFYLPLSEFDGKLLFWHDDSPDLSELVAPEATLKVIQAVVTTTCNCRCQYCQLYFNPQKAKYLAMKREVADRIISTYRNRTKNGLLIITGGEPLLNWDIVHYLIERIEGTKVIFTNATIVDKEIANQLSRHRGNVLVSFDGTKEIHDVMRKYQNGRGSFADTIKGYYALKDSDCKVGISTVVNSHNINYLEQVVGYFLDKLHPESIGLNLPHYTQYFDNSIDACLYAEKLVEIYHIAKQSGIYIDQIGRRLKPLVTEEFRFRDCSACGEKLVIYPDGRISNCINLIGFSGENDFDIWKDRIPLNLNACSKCFAIGICGGGCVFDGIMFYGKGKVDEQNCLITKRLLEEFIWDIYLTCKTRKPSKTLLKKKYAKLINRNGLRMSVGHDTQLQRV